MYALDYFFEIFEGVTLRIIRKPHNIYTVCRVLATKRWGKYVHDGTCSHTDATVSSDVRMLFGL